MSKELFYTVDDRANIYFGPTEFDAACERADKLNDETDERNFAIEPLGLLQQDARYDDRTYGIISKADLETLDLDAPSTDYDMDGRPFLRA
jgi:hypothetical protein